MIVLAIVFGTIGVFMSIYADTTSNRSNMPIIYQGRLMDASYVPKSDTDYYLAFEIYTASSGGTCKWRTETTQDGSCAGSDLTALTATTSRGLFTVVLGAGTANNPSFGFNFDGTASYLQVYVCPSATPNTTGSCETLTPRKQIGGVTYAYNSDLLDGLNYTDFLQLSPTTNAQTLTFTGTTTTTLSITASSITSGSALILTGPSSSTGITGSFVSSSSYIGASGKLVNLAPTFASSSGGSSYGIYLNPINANSSSANTIYGIYATSTDAVALGNTNYGIYNAITNTGALTAAATKTIYGNYVSVSGTGASTDATTNVYGEYITTTATHSADSGTVNNYGLYIANGTSSTSGTSTKYGLYIAEPTGADTNYAAIIAGGNVGIGTATPGGTLSVLSSNTAGTTTSAAFNLSANSLTAGTGFYAASSTLTSGLLMDLQVSGTAAAASQTALNILTTGANATNAITTYGAQISNTHTNATSGTNIALYLNASGATTANYGLIVNAGNVGIGTTSPTTNLQLKQSGLGTVGSTATVGLSLLSSVDDSQIQIYQTSAAAVIAATYSTTGSYKPLYFNTSNAATPPLVILANGNVGIGTVNPGAHLDIDKVNPTLFLRDTSDSTGPTSMSRLTLAVGGSTNNWSDTYVYGMSVSGNFGTTSIANARSTQFFNDSNATLFITYYDKPFYFIQSGGGTATIPLTIAAGGNVGIGMTPSASLDVTQGTVGNQVFGLTSTATNDDPNYKVYQGRAATTDDTLTTINTIALTANNTYIIEARVIGRTVSGGGVGCSADNGAGYVVRGTYKQVGGTASLIGSVNADYTAESDSTWAATLNVSSGNVLVQVTGSVATCNITWHSTVSVSNVGS